MEEKSTPVNLTKKVQDFAEKWNKHGQLYILNNDYGDTVAGIQIGDSQGNLHEFVININVSDEKISGFVMDEETISSELISEARELAQSILDILKISHTFGGK